MKKCLKASFWEEIQRWVFFSDVSKKTQKQVHRSIRQLSLQQADNWKEAQKGILKTDRNGLNACLKRILKSLVSLGC